jgi:hypothetical protein
MHGPFSRRRLGALASLPAFALALALATAVSAAQQSQPAGLAALHRQDAIRAIRRTASLRAPAGRTILPAYVEVEVTSGLSFPLVDERPVLTIGSRAFVMSRYSGKSMNTLIFTLTNDEFARVRTGAPVTVRYGGGGPGREWRFGRLNKAILRGP